MMPKKILNWRARCALCGLDDGPIAFMLELHLTVEGAGLERVAVAVADTPQQLGDAVHLLLTVLVIIPAPAAPGPAGPSPMPDPCSGPSPAPDPYVPSPMPGPYVCA